MEGFIHHDKFAGRLVAVACQSIITVVIIACTRGSEHKSDRPPGTPVIRDAGVGVENAKCIESIVTFQVKTLVRGQILVFGGWLRNRIGQRVGCFTAVRIRGNLQFD